MATANDIIASAARRAKILAAEESLDAAAGVDALTLLNDMMHGFGPAGIAYAHTTLTASDTVNMPDELIDSLKWMLAQRMLGEFGGVFTPDDQEHVMQARTALQSAYLVINPAVPDRALRRRRPGFFDFDRGE